MLPVRGVGFALCIGLLPVSKFKQYRLMLASLPEGVSELDFRLDSVFFRNMENPDVLGSDVQVHLRLEHKNDAYYCHFTLRGSMQIPCDRCLDPMEHEVDTEYDLAVKYGPEYDDSTDGLLIIPDTEATLDLSQLLHDTAVLTIPMRHVHPQGECNLAMTELLRDHHAGEDADEDDELSEPDQG